MHQPCCMSALQPLKPVHMPARARCLKCGDALLTGANCRPECMHVHSNACRFSSTCARHLDEMNGHTLLVLLGALQAGVAALPPTAAPPARRPSLEQDPPAHEPRRHRHRQGPFDKAGMALIWRTGCLTTTCCAWASGVPWHPCPRDLRQRVWAMLRWSPVASMALLSVTRGRPRHLSSSVLR
jgi:hypothetical protein